MANLTIDQLSADIHPINHQLRTSAPVAWIPALNAWLVTRYDLCTQVMRDAKTYTVDHPGFTTAQVVGPSMLSLDGSAHKAHRQPFESPFRKRAVTSRFHQPVEAKVSALIDDIIQQGEADLQGQFAGPLATHIMLVALGLLNTPVHQVLAWYGDIVDAVTQLSAGHPLPTSGSRAFQLLRESLVATLATQADSLLAQAAGHSAGLSQDQVISNAAVLLFGGIETTEGMIANALFHILTQASAREASQRDMAAVVEESLRLEPAAAVVDRYATCDTVLNGVEISEGDLLRVSLAAANRDPAVFEKPDVFDAFRPNLATHVTFAQGPHVCLGLHLARLEAQRALTHLLQRLPNLQLTDPQSAHPRGLIFRKPSALQASWTTANKL